MDTAPAISPLERISANLRMVLLGLRAALGAWRLEPVIAVLMYRRVGQTLARIERMLVRFQAGKLRPVTPRVVAERRSVSRKPAARLPRQFGWLVQMGQHHAAGFGCQLQTVLSTPEMVELLAASAQARRVLRPLCRALALELPGVSSMTPPVRREKTLRIRKPRVKPEPFRIPLPRGLLSAARRQGFGKMR